MREEHAYGRTKMHGPTHEDSLVIERRDEEVKIEIRRCTLRIEFEPDLTTPRVTIWCDVKPDQHKGDILLFALSPVGRR
jgi:hypothetical protein